MQNLLNDKTWNLKDQVKLMDGKDQIVVKNIKKTLMLKSRLAQMSKRKNRVKRKEKR